MHKWCIIRAVDIETFIVNEGGTREEEDRAGGTEEGGSEDAHRGARFHTAIEDSHGSQADSS